MVKKNFAKSSAKLRRFGLLMISTMLMVGETGWYSQLSATPEVTKKVPRASLFDQINGCLSMQRKGDPSPLQPYDDAVRLNPDDALAYYDRGRFRAFLGQVQEQIDDYDQAIKLDPSYADVYHRRGIARYLAGDTLGGVDDLNKAANLLINQKDSQSQQKAWDIIQHLQKTPKELSMWIWGQQVWICIG